VAAEVLTTAAVVTRAQTPIFAKVVEKLEETLTKVVDVAAVVPGMRLMLGFLAVR
jgi:hypothetical protein